MSPVFRFRRLRSSYRYPHRGCCCWGTIAVVAVAPVSCACGVFPSRCSSAITRWITGSLQKLDADHLVDDRSWRPDSAGTKPSCIWRVIGQDVLSLRPSNHQSFISYRISHILPCFSFCCVRSLLSSPPSSSSFILTPIVQQEKKTQKSKCITSGKRRRNGNV